MFGRYWVIIDNGITGSGVEMEVKKTAKHPPR